MLASARMECWTRERIESLLDANVEGIGLEAQNVMAEYPDTVTLNGGARE